MWGVAGVTAIHMVAYRGVPSARNEAATSSGCRSRCGEKPLCPLAGSTHQARMSPLKALGPAAPRHSGPACLSRSHTASYTMTKVAGQPARPRAKIAASSLAIRLPRTTARPRPVHSSEVSTAYPSSATSAAAFGVPCVSPNRNAGPPASFGASRRQYSCVRKSPAAAAAPDDRPVAAPPRSEVPAMAVAPVPGPPASSAAVASAVSGGVAPVPSNFSTLEVGSTACGGLEGKRPWRGMHADAGVDISTSSPPLHISLSYYY